MPAPHAAPADAHAPDPDRAGLDAATAPPEWLVKLLTRIILFLIAHLRRGRARRMARLPAWWVSVPGLPAGSAQEMAAAIRGPFGNLIFRMCYYDGIGPGHRDWPELSRAIVAFGGSLRGLDGRPHPRLWWRPETVPALVFATPAPAPTALLLLQRAQAEPALPLADPAPAASRPVASAQAVSPALWRQLPARAGTGPPTGPPRVRGCQSCYA